MAQSLAAPAQYRGYMLYILQFSASHVLRDAVNPPKDSNAAQQRGQKGPRVWLKGGQVQIAGRHSRLAAIHLIPLRANKDNEPLPIELEILTAQYGHCLHVKVPTPERNL